MQVTPVKYAIFSGSRDVAEVLLLAGCRVTLSDYLWCELQAPHMLQVAATSDATARQNVPQDGSLNTAVAQQGATATGSTVTSSNHSGCEIEMI